MAYKGKDPKNWEKNCDEMRRLWARGATIHVIMVRFRLSYEAARKAVFRHCKGVEAPHRWKACQLRLTLEAAGSVEAFVEALAPLGIGAEMAALIYRTELELQKAKAPQAKDSDEDAPWRPKVPLRSFGAAFEAAQAAAGRALSY